MKSMGMKIKPEQAMPIKQKVSYPSVCLSSKELPDIKDLKMGETIEARCKFKVKGLHEGWDNKDEIRCDMDMISAEIIDGPEDMKEAKNRNLSRKDWEEIKAKGNKSA